MGWPLIGGLDRWDRPLLTELDGSAHTSVLQTGRPDGAKNGYKTRKDGLRHPIHAVKRLCQRSHWLCLTALRRRLRLAGTVAKRIIEAMPRAFGRSLERASEKKRGRTDLGEASRRRSA